MDKKTRDMYLNTTKIKMYIHRKNKNNIVLHGKGLNSRFVLIQVDKKKLSEHEYELLIQPLSTGSDENN